MKIKNPLLTIKEHNMRQTLSSKIKKECKTKLSEYDIVLGEETKSLVEEYAKRCDISIEQAAIYIKSIFEEIKKNMMDLKMVKISRFGKFFLGGVSKTTDKKIRKNTSQISPTFLAHRTFRHMIFLYKQYMGQKITSFDDSELLEELNENSEKE
jgi:nucleoid DNA-binding protein